jgi:hypothetical protein
VGKSTCRTGWPQRERAIKHAVTLRETLNEGVLTTLEEEGTCKPKNALPWEAISKSRRTFGDRRANVTDTVICPPRRVNPVKNPVILAAPPVKVSSLEVECEVSKSCPTVYVGQPNIGTGEWRVTRVAACHNFVMSITHPSRAVTRVRSGGMVRKR